MKQSEQFKLVVAFSGNSWEAGMVQSLLSNAGIESFLKDYIRGTLEPWDVAAGGVNPVKVIISENDFEKAKPIVDEYYRNIKDEGE